MNSIRFPRYFCFQMIFFFFLYFFVYYAGSITEIALHWSRQLNSQATGRINVHNFYLKKKSLEQILDLDLEKLLRGRADILSLLSLNSQRMVGKKKAKSTSEMGITFFFTRKCIPAIMADRVFGIPPQRIAPSLFSYFVFLETAYRDS